MSLPLLIVDVGSSFFGWVSASTTTRGDGGACLEAVGGRIPLGAKAIRVYRDELVPTDFPPTAVGGAGVSLHPSVGSATVVIGARVGDVRSAERGVALADS
jgi:hypothetical protein